MDTNNRYSVLLVDDEEDVIQIIVKKLDWEAMGLKIIGHAANGARHCHDRYQDAIHGWTDTLPEIKRIIKNHPGHYFFWI